jgi:hypothetical protein
VDTFYFILCWFQRQPVPTGPGSVAIVPWLIPVGGAELAARTALTPTNRLDLSRSDWYRPGGTDRHWSRWPIATW